MKQDIEVNLWGTILSAHFFVPRLHPGAKILIVSSGLGLMGAAGYTVYCAAKAGLINFADALRRELYYDKKSVYVACPGDIDTPQFREEHKRMPEWMAKANPARYSVMSPQVAAKRILKKCTGHRLIITCDISISILILSKKLLPERLVRFIIDRMFPMPKKKIEP